MNQDHLSDALNYLDNTIIEETNAVRQNPKGPRKNIYKWASIAACLAIFVGSYSIIQFASKDNMEKSTTESIAGDEEANLLENQIPETADKTSSESSILVETDENTSSKQECSSTLLKQDIVIFKGTVMALTETESVSIQVEETYRGTLQKEEIVLVYLPPTSETYTLSDLTIGTHGIFMPSTSSENTYEFLDGYRYAFFETEDGLIFAREIYQSISGAVTLEEIEVYIKSMLDLQN